LLLLTQNIEMPQRGSDWKSMTREHWLEVPLIQKKKIGYRSRAITSNMILHLITREREMYPNTTGEVNAIN